MANAVDQELQQAVVGARAKVTTLDEAVRTAEARVRAPWEARLTALQQEVARLAGEAARLEAQADRLQQEADGVQLGAGRGGTAFMRARTALVVGLWLGSATYLGFHATLWAGLGALVAFPLTRGAARWLGRRRP